MTTLTMHVDVVSAEGSVFSGPARFVVLPGEAGELGIYPRHIPFLTRIKPGSVRIECEDGHQEFIFVAGGVLEIQPESVTVLSDTAIRGKDLDEEKARQAQLIAQEALKNARSSVDIARAQSELMVMAAQLAALRQFRQRL
jgi:F-type H+-transporting ATPase subunit epsilon